MGWLYQIWDQTKDPDDAGAPYTPYTFVPVGSVSPPNMTLGRNFARRETVMSVPGLDGVLDGNGKKAAPLDRADLTFGFRVFTAGDNDAPHDLLMAQIGHGRPVRLVYKTDQGALWFTYGYTPRLQNPQTAANNWGHGGYVDLAVTWRIRPYWTPRYSETAEIFRSGTVVFRSDNSETFGSVGVTAISSTSQSFTVDATGTAGLDLPTMPDSGPKVTISGPAGGSGGVQIISFTATTPDTSGILQPMYVNLPYNLPTASDAYTLDFGSQTFLYNGVPFRPVRPYYQTEWFRIENGVVNSCYVNALGTGGLTGGKVKVDWFRKRG